MISADSLASILTDRFGVSLGCKVMDDADGKHATIQPRDIPYTQGFLVEVLIGWRTIEARFVPGTYAAKLISTMENATQDQRIAFATFANATIADRATLVFQINNQDANPVQPALWPSNWRSLSIVVQKGPMVIDPSDPVMLEEQAVCWGGRILGMALSLMPLEPVEAETAGEAEGGGTLVHVMRYERSRINRAACIEIHGTKCKVCGFDFYKFYGPFGRGFIEVHHLELVAHLQTDAFPFPRAMSRTRSQRPISLRGTPRPRVAMSVAQVGPHFSPSFASACVGRPGWVAEAARDQHVPKSASAVRSRGLISNKNAVTRSVASVPTKFHLPLYGFKRAVST